MLKICELYDLGHTRACEYLRQFTYPWEALAGIADLIREIGKTLSPEEYDHPAEDVWIAKDATVYHTAFIAGPCIIGHNTEVFFICSSNPKIMFNDLNKKKPQSNNS